MLKRATRVIAVALALIASSKVRSSDVPTIPLQSWRSSPLDLEVSGQLSGIPQGEVRYVSRADLENLPQVTYSVTDDANFAGATEISGVLLETLVRRLQATPLQVMVSAVCDDRYEAHYSPAYLAAHHPLLVLKVNGQPPERWPKDAGGHGSYMGPYLISHEKFVPSFKILSHEEEAQIPWGVIGLKFADERMVLHAIAPRARTGEPAVQAGFRIAQQNCFRCHNAGEVGGKKAGRPWLVLSAWATASPEHFTAYVRNPKSKNPHAEMPGNPDYDDATLKVLLSYFQTFQSGEKP